MTQKISFKDDHFTVEHGCVTDIYNIEDIKSFIEVEEDLLSVLEYEEGFYAAPGIPYIMMKDLAERYNKPYAFVEELEDIEYL